MCVSDQEQSDVPTLPWIAQYIHLIESLILLRYPIHTFQCPDMDNIPFHFIGPGIEEHYFLSYSIYHEGMSTLLTSPNLKQYSEISGRLKHPFSLTPIDRYSLEKLMFKISIGYDFTLARYAE